MTDRSVSTGQRAALLLDAVRLLVVDEEAGLRRIVHARHSADAPAMNAALSLATTSVAIVGWGDVDRGVDAVHRHLDARVGGGVTSDEIACAEALVGVFETMVFAGDALDPSAVHDLPNYVDDCMVALSAAVGLAAAHAGMLPAEVVSRSHAIASAGRASARR